MQSVAEIPFLGGHVALDFVNTAEGRGHPDAGEALRTADDLRQWGERRGVIAAGSSSNAADDELQAAIEARELLYRLLLDQSRGHRVRQQDLATLERLASDAYQVAHLDQQADGRLSWSWDLAQLSTVRYVAVTSALELLSHGTTARLKQCPGDDCGWFFIDTTKRGNRRWCSMSECGQEAKTARRRVRPASHRA
ncbi:MAG TPA: ABATE domain-containing protein [Trebonia sp.]|nr:ABATE domain-containing protein [Trebonia sp.]